MINDTLLKFIIEQIDYLSSLNSTKYNKDIEKRCYAQTVKLSEEVGELSEALLAHFNNIKRDKNGKQYSVEDEIADVIITVLGLARHLKVDVNEALEQKVKILVDRRN